MTGTFNVGDRVRHRSDPGVVGTVRALGGTLGDQDAVTVEWDDGYRFTYWTGVLIPAGAER